MKNFLTSKVLRPLTMVLTFVMAMAISNVNAQINYTENFETSTASIAGWTATNGTGTVILPTRIQTAPCSGTANLAHNQYQTANNIMNYVSPSLGVVACGRSMVSVSALFKAAVWSANVAAPAANQRYQLTVQWGLATSAAALPATWTNINAAPIEMGSATCLPFSGSFALPTGVCNQFLRIRFVSNRIDNDGDVYVNFDDIAVTQTPLAPADYSITGIANQTVALPFGTCQFNVPSFGMITSVCNPVATPSMAPAILPTIALFQTSGPAPGTIVPIGTYTLTYEARCNGVTLPGSQRSMTLSVGGTPITTANLVCNDHVNVSADENCEVYINADMFLEGGHYGCYEYYQVNIWPFKSQANAINNITQNRAYNLPCGDHTYEIMDPITGNKCWGTFTVEDKLAPTIVCSCEDAPVILPLTSISGQFTTSSPTIQRSTTSTTCTPSTTADRQTPYSVVIPFTVTTAGTITFTATSTYVSGPVNSNFAYQYIYNAPPNPADLCAGFVTASSATTWTPTVTNLGNTQGFVPGVTYYYVYASAYLNNILSYNITFAKATGGGIIESIQNPANAPECQFNCYDLDVVSRETIPMLLGAPGASKAVLTAPPAFSDACGSIASLTFEDRITNSNCGSSKLRRDWKVVDAKGNVATCSQTFSFNQIAVTNLTVPTREVLLSCGVDASPAGIVGYTDIDSRTRVPQDNCNANNIGAYCDDWAQTPSVEELNEGNVNGYFTYDQIGFDGNLHPQKITNDLCNIYITYSDQTFNACGIGCGGNMKVIRDWRLLDWCTGQTFTYIQVIKAADDKAPTFDVKDHTVSVDPWGCVASWPVDKPWELQDNCAKAEEVKWAVKAPAGVTVSGTHPNYTLSGMPKGRHAVTYIAEDCCGNISEKVAFVTVIDASAPVAVAKQNIVMSLTGSGTAADGAGKIYGWQIDNGSYDHCTEVRFEVRRTSGGACGNVGANNHNNNSTYNHSPNENLQQNVWAHPQDTRNNNVVIDTDGGEFVKFCCADIPAGSDHGLHEVELRVWDDGNMNGVYGDNEIIDGMRDNYNTTWVTVRVENKLPPTLVCPVNVTLNCDMEVNLSEGKETNIKDVDLTMTGYPKAYDLCSDLEITYSDVFIGDKVCKIGTIERTFKVTKGSVVVQCLQRINLTAISAPFTVTFSNNNGTTEWDRCDLTLEDIRDLSNPAVKRPIVNSGVCDIIGENITIDTFLIEDGACKKWRVTYEYKNWCTGASITEISGSKIVHWYTFKDEEAPILTCQNVMLEAKPSALNPNGGCEAEVTYTASAIDKLECAKESWVKWQMFFDGWSDGTVDRLASSFVLKTIEGRWLRLVKGAPAAGPGLPTWAMIQAQHPGFTLADVVYITYLKPTKASGGTVTIPVGTGADKFILDAENISHKVTWKITDGCGNVDQCESTVMVVDKKAPTPYCVSISTALMQTNPKMVELWAKDFDKGAFDNCSPQSVLYFTFEGVAPIYSRINEPHFYKAGAAGSVNATAAEYNQGKAYRWLPDMRSAGFVWTAAGDYNVKVSVWDEAWNTDYCTVALKVVDNGPTGSRVVSGTVKTATDANVNAVSVTFDANVIEYPKTTSTVANGTFSMENPEGLRYEVSASKGGDYLNGVSTLDLVMIQRHILGIQTLDDNYKLIAADANNDGRVTASDLSELRKLILGVTSELPNASWRFPVAGTAVQTSPISFTETIEIANLSSDMNGQNFVAVKIGDVNGNVAVNANNDVVEARSNNTVAMTVAEAAVIAGEVVEIPVTAANFADVAGFQYTMNLKGASFVGINSGAIEMSANNVGVLTNGNVTMSYANSEAVSANEGDVLFTLVVRANQAMKVSEMMTLNSSVTKSESYNSDLKVGSVSLSVRTAPVASIELFQNEPNPFRGQTTVSFTMPEAGAATLTVYDMTGKQVVVRNIDATKGLNSEIFTKEQLGVSGVMYYTLESGDFTATKKMIIVE